MSDYYIGLMSGTSMDAIDAALVSIDDNHTQLIKSHNHPLPESVTNKLHALIACGKDARLDDCMTLDVELGQLFADAVIALLTDSGIQANQIKAIGSHGQTAYHHPEGMHPYTLQIGDPNIIAEMTGITTVADFRRRDLCVGGQGAPLAPAFHQFAFHSDTENRAIINIGGIANISVLPADNNLPIYGFDTGPGNTLLDQWAMKYLGKSMDLNGEFARSGTCNNELLLQLLSDDYFSSPIPKSTGREYFNLKWLNKNMGLEKISPEDIQATLTELTIQSISMAIKEHAPAVQHIYVCGGGSHNPLLMSGLQRASGLPVDDSSSCGIGPDWVEAVAFAWLASKTLNAQPANLPSVTGARSKVILGGIYPG